METERNSEQMSKQKRERQLLAFTGATALVVLAVAFFNSNRKKHKNDLRGSNVRVDFSASEILNLADRIIATSKQVHDAVALVPFDKVSYMNVLSPLAELDAEQFPLVQSCVFPKLVSPHEDVRRASAEAERRIDAHVLSCRSENLSGMD